MPKAKKKPETPETDPTAAPAETAAPTGLSDPRVVAILKKYYLAGEDGQVRQVNLQGYKDTKGKAHPVAVGPAGPGPIVETSVLERLLAIDPTKDKKYFDWMLNEAGGGAAAHESSKAFLTKSMAQYREARSKTIPADELDAAVEAFAARIMPLCYCADEDLMAKIGNSELFGYYRAWPGFEGRYETVAKEVKKYIANLSEKVNGSSKLGQINQARQQAAADGKTEFKQVPIDIRTIPSLTALSDLNHEFSMFYKKKQVTKDLRWVAKHPEKGWQHSTDEVPIHANGTYRVLIPATIMASLKSGAPHVRPDLSGWCISSQGQKDEMFPPRGGQSRTTHWQNYNSHSAFVFLSAIKPLKNPKLKHIACQYSVSSGSATFWDASDHSHSLSSIVEMAKAEGINADLTDAIKAADASWKEVRNLNLVKIDPLSEMAHHLVSQMLD